MEQLKGPTIQAVTFDSETIKWAKEKEKNTFHWLGVQTLRVVTIKHIEPLESSFSPDSGGVINVKLYAEARTYYRGNISQPIYEYKPFSAKTTVMSAQLAPDRWFEKKYPRLNIYLRWKTIKDKTIDDAIKSVEDEIIGKLREHQPTLIGMRFHGKDIGWVGPTIIIVLLAYLAIHLQHIYYRVRDYGNEAIDSTCFGIAPWVGVMPERFHSYLTFLTLAFLPALTVYLSFLWVFLPLTFNLYDWLARSMSAVPFVIVLGVGIWCWFYARRIAKIYANRMGNLGNK